MQKNNLRAWMDEIDHHVAFLSECLAEVLVDLGEQDLTHAIPWRDGQVRGSAKGSPDLLRVNRELQVMSIAYHLLNIVEEQVAATSRRDRERREGLLTEQGLWGDSLRRLRDRGISESEIVESLEKVHVEVVLTAHPTEAKRPVVLRQHRALFAEYAKLQESHWTPQEREAIRDQIKVLLERLWRTGEMHLRKPDVLSELEDVIDYLAVIFPRAVLELRQRLRDAWTGAGFDPKAISPHSLRPRLFFGNWVGGDRDGHPFVTGETTRRAFSELRGCAIRLIKNQLDSLAERLTLSDLFQDVPAELKRAIIQKRRQLQHAKVAHVKTFPHEPWREFVYLLGKLLEDGRERLGHPYIKPDALRRDLVTLINALVSVGAERIARADVEPILVLLDTFGYHSAVLDIRQNSDFHAVAVSQLLKASGFKDWNYAKWGYAKRREFLDRELTILRPLAPRGGKLGEQAESVLSCYCVVAEYIGTYGSEGLGSFIVSMTRDVTDLLVVYLFAREAGLLHADGNGISCSLSIVPLFETLDDLRASPSILNDFLQHPITKRGRKRFHQPQQVMVGYSNSNKSGGMFASQWALNAAQRALTEVCRKNGSSGYFFHGRGGTFSRGAGPTNRFLEALPRGTMSGRVRLTEQGEVIAQKFGNLPTAVYNLELLLAGVAMATVEHGRAADVDPQLRALGERLSVYSQEAYSEQLSSPGFISFWSEATPIDALECSFIGSRPARRTGKRTIHDLRAIPWVFSWAQARYYLPGWFGVGSALERLAAEDPKGFYLLRQGGKEWPFVRYVLYNVETSLASADLAIMKLYASLVEDPILRKTQFTRISQEYIRTERMLERFFGAARTIRRPRLTKTLAMRAKGLERLHHIQVDLLRDWRSLRTKRQTAKADRILPSLLLSVNAIASAERTTG